MPVWLNFVLWTFTIAGKGNYYIGVLLPDFSEYAEKAKILTYMSSTDEEISNSIFTWYSDVEANLVVQSEPHSMWTCITLKLTEVDVITCNLGRCSEFILP